MGSGTRNSTAGTRSIPSGAVERTGLRTVLRAAGVLLVAAVAVGLTPAVADAAPRRPSDSQIAQAKAQADAVAGRMGQLNDRLTAAQAQVDAARAEAMLALDEFQATQEAFEAARVRAEAAAAAAVQAEADLVVARGEVVAFARRSYMQGSTFPGAAALLTAGGPGELVEKAALLEAAGMHRTDVLEVVTVVQVAAEQAETVAQVAVAEADMLQATAAATLEIAQVAEISAREQETALVAEQAEVETQFAAAQQELTVLVGARAAADRAAAVRPAPAPVPAPAPAPAPAPGPPSTGGPAPVTPPANPGSGNSSKAQRAIDAAMNYLGTPYAWGGGGTRGPGPGQDPDRGVVGFDCSGLTQYAYAQAGISIPRNSRAQYAALPKVSSDDLRPGDLVFWGTDSRNPSSITHVAIYLGGDRVVQAPESGDVVKVSPMWWRGYVGAVRPTA